MLPSRSSWGQPRLRHLFSPDWLLTERAVCCIAAALFVAMAAAGLIGVWW